MSTITRFLSKRDRERQHSSSHIEKINAQPFIDIFCAEEKKPVDKEEEKKVKYVLRRLRNESVSSVKDTLVRGCLRSSFANGDQVKAFELVSMYQDALENRLCEVDAGQKLLGAENREGVTCYLDALLFAMFARLQSFDSILYNDLDNGKKRHLATVLRLWVNMLRKGKLITTDVTEALQDSLAECGWKSASDLMQQDVSEAFTFITGELQLPLLTLKMDIFHTGKEDVTDDHKFINERLLEVAIPLENKDGGMVRLEECLEDYFNNKIEVRRFLERHSTVTSTKSIDSMKGGVTAHIESVGLDPRPSSPTSSSVISSSSTPATPLRPVKSRHRASSIIQEVYIPPEDDSEKSTSDSETLVAPRKRRRRGTIRKEVMMPAWQFFRLIPWYTDNTPNTDAQVAAHFSLERPVLGLCLKRYSMNERGQAIRLGTQIDVPLDIALPHFIQDDSMSESGPIFGNFKLSLQSVVCHRGSRVDSGHYISLVRETGSHLRATRTLSTIAQTSCSDNDEVWLLFDDLATERVTVVDIESTLKKESPYLLFYQVQPIEDVNPVGFMGEDQPPSYAESERDSGVGLSTVSGGSSNGDSGPRISTEITNSEISIDIPLIVSSEENVVQPSTSGSTAVEFIDGPGDEGNVIRKDTATSIQPEHHINRRSSKIAAFMSSMRPSASSDSQRSSGTFSRFTLNIRKGASSEKIDRSGENSTAVSDFEDANETGEKDDDASVRTPRNEPATLATPIEGSPQRRRKRDKSKGGGGKGGKQHRRQDSDKGKEKDQDKTKVKSKEKKKPDRECLMM